MSTLLEDHVSHSGWLAPRGKGDMNQNAINVSEIHETQSAPLARA
jgi:hypothetical protein